MQKLFPTTQRRKQTLAFVHRDLVAYLRDQVMASAQDLGDVTKDTPEEIREREARVVMQGVAALRNLLLAAHGPPGADEGTPVRFSGNPDHSPGESTRGHPPERVSRALGHSPEDSGESAVGQPPERVSSSQSQTGSDAQSDSEQPSERSRPAQTLCALQQALASVWASEPFWKRLFSWKTDAAILIEICQLVLALATHQPVVLRAQVHMLAPLVYGTLACTRPETHNALFAMLLRFGQAAPDALRVDSVVASFPDNLFKTLKQSASSGAVPCASALLPMAMQMAQHGDPAWGAPEFAAQWLEVLTQALRSAGVEKVHERLSAAYAEVLVYFVTLHGDAGRDLAQDTLRGFVDVSRAAAASQSAVSTSIARSIVNGMNSLPF